MSRKDALLKGDEGVHQPESMGSHNEHPLLGVGSELHSLNGCPYQDIRVRVASDYSRRCASCPGILGGPWSAFECGEGQSRHDLGMYMHSNAAMDWIHSCCCSWITQGPSEEG